MEKAGVELVRQRLDVLFVALDDDDLVATGQEEPCGGHGK